MEVYAAFEEEHDLDEIAPLVIHTGSKYCQIGRAGDDSPFMLLESNIGISKEGEKYFGSRASRNENNLKLRLPLMKGVFQDIDTLESIWHHIFYSELRVDMSREALLLTEPVLNPKATRERICKLVFEEFRVSVYFTYCSSVLGLFSYGFSSGIVVDSGHQVTNIVPVYEEHVVVHAVQTSNIAGEAIDKKLMELLIEKGHSFEAQHEKDIVSNIKERCCFVAYDIDEQRNKSNLNFKYKLPNGNILHMGNEVFEAPEIIFSEGNSLPKLCNNVVLSCHKDLPQTEINFYDHIVFVGGTTFLPGIVERFHKSMVDVMPTGFNLKLRCIPERKYATWIGGSIVGSLTSFGHIHISREEYLEKGPTIVHEKCK